MRMLKCELFPVVVVLVDDEKQFNNLTKKSEYHGAFPVAGAAATVCFSGDSVGVIILVAIGDTDELTTDEAHSILTHEAVHVKQFTMENIGEEHVGPETEAYAVQYFADYLIKEWTYRQTKKELKHEQE